MTRRPVPMLVRSLAPPLVAVGLVALVVLLVGAALTGPGQVLGGEGLDRVPLAQPTESESALAGESDGSGEQARERREVSPLLRTLVRGLVLLLELAVLAAAGWLLWRGARAAWARWDARRRRDPGAEELSGEQELVDGEQVRQDLLRDAEGRRERLASGEPRNAVVACWLELEGLAAAHGVARRPAETSTELTRRCLDRTGADPAALAALAAAYHRARFSEHPVTGADRSVALRALDRVHESLAARQRHGAGA